MIHLGDCLTALQCLTKRHAWVTDPPANIGFMGRKWDKASAAGLWQPRYVHSSANLADLRSDNEFTEYWAERFGMMNDLTVDDGVAIVWALPRTQHLTQAALRYAGWKVPFVFDHIFGQGWNKNGGHLKPGHESWIIATKGHYELGIEACRIPRGDMSAVSNGGRMGYGGGSDGYDYKPHSNGAHPIDVGLSHCEECVRAGKRKVATHGGSATIKRSGKKSFFGIGKGEDVVTQRPNGGGKSESVDAFQCLAGCACGRSWLAMAGGKAPRCECGKQGQWACPWAEANGQSGDRPGMSGGGKHRNGSKGGMFGAIDCEKAYGDSGGISRFFHNFAYFAKASGRTDDKEVRRLEKLEKKLAKTTDPIAIARLERQIREQLSVVEAADNAVPSGERHAGCENLFWRAKKKNPFGFDRVTREEWETLDAREFEGKDTYGAGVDKLNKHKEHQRARGNVHPTVKSLGLMMHLVKLSGALNPRDEPFRVGDLTVGSGSTAIASQLLGAEFDGAEMCPEAIEIANARLAFWAGITPQSLESFILTGDMPGQTRADAQQGSLF